MKSGASGFVKTTYRTSPSGPTISWFCWVISKKGERKLYRGIYTSRCFIYVYEAKLYILARHVNIKE